ncbi:hypothetical protein BCR35DRAFT_305013 [Leucosporidium creatinivorum]|uniref:Uncharacterized protein n=1 Tax=Leucosporidium creatinivorum TaxID=106004 RepID=A0A1Y2F3D5_9BASI|nr:hypothetical protein BCR35DRAFT_305013 [Leucosporidium creatinivorum]
MKLSARGGVAGGDASSNPTQTIYASIPPSSTYRGPKVAGTYTGFVGVFVGAGIFTLILLSIFILLRYRHLRRTNAASSARGGPGESDFHRGREEHEEAFEMPRSWRGGGGDGDVGNESTASFDPAEFRGADGDGGREEPFYSNLAESRSREVFLEPVCAETRYDDPFERKEAEGRS